MSIKGERIGEQGTFWHFGERGYFVGEKNRGWGASSELRAWRKASALWFFEEESYSISVSGSHHQRTWIIFGGDSEVSMLNFIFLPTGHLHRLRMLLLLSHPLLFPLMWRLYCFGMDNKGHTCLLLIGYEWLRITVKDDCFLDVLESRLGSSLIHSSFSIQHHSWLPLLAMKNTCLSLSGSHSSRLGIENRLFFFASLIT